MKTTSQTQSQTPLSKLTICCLDSETQEPVAPDFTIEQPAGTTFTVENLPEIEGYIADRKQVCGCMPEWDKCFPIIVYYRPVPQSEKSDRSTRRFMATVLSVLMILSVCVRLIDSAHSSSAIAEDSEKQFIGTGHYVNGDEVDANDPNADPGYWGYAPEGSDNKRLAGKSLITILYEYDDGSPAATSYQGYHDVGSTFEVASPTLDGYLPSKAVFSGMVLDATDKIFTVTYRKNPQANILQDPSYQEGAETAGGKNAESIPVNGTQPDPEMEKGNFQPVQPAGSGQKDPTVDPAKDNLQPMDPTPIKPEPGEENPASVDYGEVTHPNPDRSVPEGDYAPQDPLTPSTR